MSLAAKRGFSLPRSKAFPCPAPVGSEPEPELGAPRVPRICCRACQHRLTAAFSNALSPRPPKNKTVSGGRAHRRGWQRPPWPGWKIRPRVSGIRTGAQLSDVSIVECDGTTTSIAESNRYSWGKRNDAQQYESAIDRPKYPRIKFISGT
jgi:hypothetical protein